MPRPKLNRARERRIEQEIVVDAYTPEERAIGWHCYGRSPVSNPTDVLFVARRHG